MYTHYTDTPNYKSILINRLYTVLMHINKHGHVNKNKLSLHTFFACMYTLYVYLLGTQK